VTDDTHLIDNLRLQSIVAPRSVAEIGDLVRHAAKDVIAIYPLGGRTALHFGLSPVRSGLGVDLRNLSQVIDFPARDMTVTVQAGISIAKLQAVLATEKLRLAVDVPRPDTATLGGAIAVNASGPRRYGLGTLRDYVIGISFVTDGGAEAKAGGRVVKNVAGYDLCKLHIGALGTLGIVTQATLKLRPIPDASLLVSSTCRIDELSSVLTRIHESTTRPISVDVESSNSADACRLHVGFEDNLESVRWQFDRICKELYLKSPSRLEGDAAASEWGRLTESQNLSSARLSFKARLLSSGIPEFLRTLAAIKELQWIAHAGSGVVIGHLHGNQTMPDAMRLLNDLRERAAAAKGGMIVTRCPPEWKKHINIWGDPGDDFPLMRRVKQALDPGDLFNPGRLFV
jgi:glycolate oxidase FAD binding subunit